MALAALMVILLLSGLGVFAMALFQVPIAYCWLGRKEAMALGMVCIAALAPVVMTGFLMLGVIFGVTASLGLLLGILARRHTSIGITIAALTAALYVLVASWSIAGWSDVCSEFHDGIEQYKITLESQTEENVILYC